MKLFTACQLGILIALAASIDATNYFIQMKNSSTIDNLLKFDDQVKTTHHLRPMVKKIISFGNFEGFSGEFTKETIEKLRRNPLVKTITTDFPISIFEDEELEVDTNELSDYYDENNINAGCDEDTENHDTYLDYDTQFMAPRHLARLSRRGRLPLKGQFNYYYDPNFNGKGVYAYVIDTGIYKEHPDFEGRAIFGANVLDSDVELSISEGGDDHGHGTHVAGVIGSKTFGVAKGSTLVEIKALNKDGTGTFSSVIAGLEFAVNHRREHNVRGIANLSLGSMKNDILNTEIRSAVDSGLVVVVAAGNAAVDSCLTSPASSPDAITVGAIDDRADIIAYFSNFGRCIDVFASGIAIESLAHDSDQRTAVMSGTSMSSPSVAGLGAILLQQGVSVREVGSKISEMSTSDKIAQKSMSYRKSPNKLAFNGVNKPDDEFPEAPELSDEHFQDNYRTSKVDIGSIFK